MSAIVSLAILYCSSPHFAFTWLHHLANRLENAKIQVFRNLKCLNNCIFKDHGIENGRVFHSGTSIDSGGAR